MLRRSPWQPLQTSVHQVLYFVPFCALVCPRSAASLPVSRVFTFTSVHLHQMFIVLSTAGSVCGTALAFGSHHIPGLDPSHLGVAAYVVLQQDYRSTADGWTIYSHSTHGLPVNLAGN